MALAPTRKGHMTIVMEWSKGFEIGKIWTINPVYINQTPKHLSQRSFGLKWKMKQALKRTRRPNGQVRCKYVVITLDIQGAWLKAK